MQSDGGGKRVWAIGVLAVVAGVALAVWLVYGRWGGGAAPLAKHWGANAGGDAGIPGRLENGAYLILREAGTAEGAAGGRGDGVVMAYDRTKYSESPVNVPLSYVAIDPLDYIPFVIDGAPTMTRDGVGKKLLEVSLARKNIAIAEKFTRTHLGGRIAMVIGGEVVTLHKIRTVVTDGRIQITRCTDDACEVIRGKLVQ